MVSSSFLSPDLMDGCQGVIPDLQLRSDTSLAGLELVRAKPVEQNQPTVLRGASAVEPLPPVLSGDSQPQIWKFSAFFQKRSLVVSA